ncbi:hypothetical protein L6R49_22135 [Myxococcota bacterium]|nr:hypothetical protein [Myxococcota bacterium]
MLTQDVLRKPLAYIHPATVADLFALSELSSLPKPLPDDLARFCKQMAREYNDLHDGRGLEDVLAEYGDLPPARVPTSLRALILGRLASKTLSPTNRAGLEALGASWEGVNPEVVKLPEGKKARVERPPVPDSHKAPEERLAATSAPALPGARARVAAAPKTPAAARDQRRDEWVREDMLDRLRSSSSNGLKQSILVAGARHRSPYKDLAEEEVLYALKRLEKDGLARLSAGRWSYGRA